MRYRVLAGMLVALILNPSARAEDNRAEDDPIVRSAPLEEAELAQYHYRLALLRLTSLSLADHLSVIAELRTAIRLRPDFVEAHAQLGNILLQGGDTDGALDEFRLATRRAP